MYNPIQEKRNEICNNIAKSFGNVSEPEDIEKAKWQIGEVRVDSRGIAHECFEYTADGKPHLRRVKKQKGAPTTSTNSEVDNFMKLVQKFSNKYTDESKVTVSKTPKGNWDVSYDGHRLGIINADQLSEKTVEKKGWLKKEDEKTTLKSNQKSTGHYSSMTLEEAKKALEKKWITSFGDDWEADGYIKQVYKKDGKIVATVNWLENGRGVESSNMSMTNFDNSVDDKGNKFKIQDNPKKEDKKKSEKDILQEKYANETVKQNFKKYLGVDEIHKIEAYKRKLPEYDYKKQSFGEDVEYIQLSIEYSGRYVDGWFGGKVSHKTTYNYGLTLDGKLIEIREHTVGRGLNLKRAILINNSWDMLKNKPNKYN